MSENYIEPKTHLTDEQVSGEKYEAAQISTAFGAACDQITAHMKVRTTGDEKLHGNLEFREMFNNPEAADFLAVGITEDDYNENPYLQEIVSKWFRKQPLLESEIKELREHYIQAVREGKLNLPAQFLN